MDKMILKDGTEVTLEAGSSLTDIRVASASREAMLTVWEKLTPDNLAEVTIKTDAGLTVGEYTDLILEAETSVVDSAGAVATSFRMRQKTDAEKRLDALEAGQEIQDGAIADLGEVTSQLVGGGE